MEVKSSNATEMKQMTAKLVAPFPGYLWFISRASRSEKTVLFSLSLNDTGAKMEVAESSVVDRQNETGS